MDLSALNPAQRQAVLHTEGPLLVLAGAGSGKTRVITHRIEHLIERGCKPEQIVALSFTNKAANEMRERLSKMIGKKQAEALVLGTFHSLGAWMMREDPKGFEMRKRFQILDQGDVYGVVRTLLREYGYHGPGSKRYDLGAITQRISLWKNDFLSVEKVKRLISSNDYDEVAAELYEAYEDRLRSLAAVDFDDLVCRVAAYLRDDPSTARRWQRRFRYLLVDEYQDTNTAQFQMLLGLMGEDNRNLCVVGDDDQAIYGWRGAKVANILGFDMYFRDATVIKLEANYRSLPPITTCANHLIAHNTARHDKELVPHRRGGEKVQVVVTRDGPMEAAWVSDKIYQMVREQRIPPKAIAVLYRSTRQVRIIEQNLQEHGIEFRVLGGQPFYDKKEVKDATAYLKLLVMPSDEIAVRRALDTPSKGIGRKTIERLTTWAEAHDKRLIDAVYNASEVEGITGRPKASLERFAQQIRHAQGEARTRNVSEALRRLLSEVRLRDNVVKDTGSGKVAQSRWGSVEFLLESIDRFERRAWDKNEKPKWHEYLGNLDLKKKDEEEVKDQVTLSTFHSSKGLEWPKVFILGVEEGTMPHKRTEAPRLSDAIAGDLEEERRLFYVGITRARDQLWLTRAATRVDRGRELEIRPSRFLEELPGEESGVIEHYDVREQEKLTSQTLDDLAGAFLSKLSASLPSPDEQSPPG